MTKLTCALSMDDLLKGRNFDREFERELMPRLYPTIDDADIIERVANAVAIKPNCLFRKALCDNLPLDRRKILCLSARVRRRVP
jgi:hypothetical protein